MANLIIVRHAQSEWNASGRWQGHADTSLSEHGRVQARRAAAALGALDAIAASDLTRAVQTAEIIAEAVGIGDVAADAGLRERDIGEWQGLATEQIERRYPGALASGRRPPGWESDESLLGRVIRALRRAARLARRLPARSSDRSAVDDAEGDVLVVAHAGVLYALEQHFGCPFGRVDNLAGRRLHVAPAGMTLGSRIALAD